MGQLQDILWLTQAFGDVPSDNAWLGQRELAVLERFRVAKRLREWRLGRWTAKCAVASALGQGVVRSFPSLQIIASTDGVPEAWVEGRPVPVSISISHCDDLGLAVVGPASLAVGCDVESVDERTPALVADYLTPLETAFVEASARGRGLRATLVWSAKESALKALRTGLRADARSVEISVPRMAERDGWKILEIHPDPLWGWWREEGPTVITVVSNARSYRPVPATRLDAAPYVKS